MVAIDWWWDEHKWLMYANHTNYIYKKYTQEDTHIIDTNHWKNFIQKNLDKKWQNPAIIIKHRYVMRYFPLLCILICTILYYIHPSAVEYHCNKIIETLGTWRKNKAESIDSTDLKGIEINLRNEIENFL